MSLPTKRWGIQLAAGCCSLTVFLSAVNGQQLTEGVTSSHTWEGVNGSTVVVNGNKKPDRRTKLPSEPSKSLDLP